MASLPKGMDRVMKAQIAGLVASGERIPALENIPDARPFSDRLRLEKFRHWQSFQREVTIHGETVKAWGEIDDLIEHSDLRVSAWDFKTKGDEPDEAYGKKWYGDQLDFYHLLLEGQNLLCTGKGYLSYGWPDKIVEGAVIFGWKNIELDTDPGRAICILEMAVTCLKGPKPLPGDCEWCAYSLERQNEAVMTPKAKVSKR